MRLHRPSAATVLAGLALFVALGSTSFAEPARQAAKRMLTGKDIKNGTLRLADFAKADRGKLVGSRGPVGPTGTAGIAGTPGAKGAQGDDGQRGPAGTAVKARMRFAGSTASGTLGSPVSIPLTASTIEQAAGETLFLLGEITVQHPAQCQATPNVQTTLTWAIYDGSSPILSGYLQGFTGTTSTARIPGPVVSSYETLAFLMEPDAPVTRDIQFRVYDNCPQAGEDSLVKSVKLNAFALG
jgi:hypothetical protein